MSPRSILCTLLTFMVATVLTACQYYVPAAPATGEASMTVENTFTSRAEDENGIITMWSGNAGGHRPGETSIFELAFENQSDDLWDVRYCIYLLGQPWHLEELAAEEFTLEPGEGRVRDLVVAFPADLEPAAYTLAQVVRRPTGPTVELNAINVGDRGTGRLPEIISVSEDLVEVARAQCVPAEEAYPDDVMPTGAAEDAVRLFYWDYLQAAHPDADGNRSSPLAEGAYLESPHLAPGFARQVESMVENGISFDPFLCTQDLPTSFNIRGATFTEDAIFVEVKTGMGNTLHAVVAGQGDAWRIINVICDQDDLPASLGQE